MNYRGISDLNEDIIKWIPQLPQDIELVVGIPRSGLLAANLLSLHLNIPMADLDGFLESRILSAGRRMKEFDKYSFLHTPRTVLVVDDSLATGSQMDAARSMIEQAMLPHHVSFAAVYVGTFEQMSKIDYYFQHLPVPQLFEWNMFHRTLENTCVDIDGVLCPDPKYYEDDDGDIYEQFLRSVPALRIPTYTIGWLVTCRLEKYRVLTVEWLRQHSIRFNNLIMMEYPDKKTRQREGAYSRFKASVYLKTGADLFIESSPHEAEEIVRLSGKYVYCTSTHLMISPSSFDRMSERVKEELRKTRQYPLQRLKGFYHALRWWGRRILRDR